MSKEAMKQARDFISRLKFADAEPEPEIVMAVLDQAIAEAEKQEQGESVGYLEIDDIESQREYPHNCRNVNLWYEGGEGLVAIYTTPYVATQRQQRPFIKPLTDEQTIILKNTTCPEINWKARHFVEMNNGERNKWMLEWFMAFKIAIEAAHGITSATDFKE